MKNEYKQERALEVVEINKRVFEAIRCREYVAVSIEHSGYGSRKYNIYKGISLIYCVYVEGEIGIPEELAEKQLNDVCEKLNIPFRFNFEKEEV